MLRLYKGTGMRAIPRNCVDTNRQTVQFITRFRAAQVVEEGSKASAQVERPRPVAR